MGDTISADILIATRSLVANKGQWTKCAYARNEAGHEVHHLDANATSFCSMGAVAKVLGRSKDEIAQLTTGGYFAPLEKALGGRSDERDGYICVVQVMNDRPDTAHRQVLAMFDRAIKHARVEGSGCERPSRPPKIDEATAGLGG